MTIEAISKLISDHGISVCIVTVIFFMLWKGVPKIYNQWLEVYKETKRQEQEAFAERQRLYREQTERIITACDRANEVIAQNNEVMRHVTTVIASVIGALGQYGYVINKD
jgi:shikimate kinase